MRKLVSRTGQQRPAKLGLLALRAHRKGVNMRIRQDGPVGQQ